MSAPPNLARVGRLYVGFGAAADAIEWGLWLGLLIWWIEVLALSPLQLVALGSVLGAAVIVTETPTGVVADMYSRKWSIVIGLVVGGIGYAWAVISTNYWVILPAQVLAGVGWTFRSGAEVAWVTDELKSGNGDLDVADEVEDLLLRRHRFGMALGILVIVAMMTLGQLSVRWVVVATGAATVALGVGWARWAPEDHFVARPERQTFMATLREGLATVRGRPRLRVLVVVVLLASLGEEVIDRLGYVRFIDSLGVDDESIVTTGVLFIVLAAFGVIVNLIVTGYIERSDQRGSSTNPMIKPTALLLAIAAIGVLLVGIAGGAAIIGLGLMLQDATRESSYPLMEAWTNREVEANVRATVHSLVSQATSVGEIVGGLVIGWLAEIVGIPFGIVIAAALVALAAATAPTALRSSK